VPRASPEGPLSEPENVPPTMYSRVDAAVVSGATGSCVSYFDESVSVQPSGS